MKALPVHGAAFAAAAFLSLSPLPVAGQDAGAETARPWQQVISSQIQAFRDRDAPEAFSYAGGMFQATFPNAETFFIAVVQSGYGPIVESDSHSFGTFRRIGERRVVQQVKFIGRDQMLYDAMYQLVEEDAGWRIQGMQLMAPRGIAV